MSRRKVERADLRKLAIGDMKTPVIVHGTEITAPVVGVDFGRRIEPVINPWFCKVRTLRGVTLFDSSNNEKVITHEFAGRFSELITENMFIEYRGIYYKVVLIEDFEESEAFTVCLCTERGNKDREVNAV